MLKNYHMPLTQEQLIKRRKTNKKIILFLVIPVIVLWIIILIILKDKHSSMPFSAFSNFSIDSVIDKIKNEDVIPVGEVIFNKSDSTINIAVIASDKEAENMDNTATYFFDTYDIGRINSVDGVAIYQYKKGKKMSGDPLSHISKQYAQDITFFKKKYCYDDYCRPVRLAIQSKMNDPESFEPATIAK